MSFESLSALNRCLAVPIAIVMACIALLVVAPDPFHDPWIIATFCVVAALAFAEGMFYARRDRAKDRRAQAELRESEERFRRLGNSAPVMLWMTSAGDEPLFASQPWLDFTGQRESDALESGFNILRKVMHPDDYADAMAAVDAAVARREPFSVEYRLRRHDGEYRWVLDSGIARFTPEGDYVGFAGMVVDIHDRRTVEAALRASEQRLRMLVENVPLVQMVTDRDGVVLLLEGGMLEGLGLRAGELVGGSAFDYYAGNDDALTMLRRALAGESQTGLVFAFDRWWDVYFTPAYDGAGAVAGAVIVGLDVTAREHAKAAHGESEARYRLIARATIDAIWDWDLATGYIWRSEGFTTQFGYPPEEIGNDIAWWEERVHPDDLQAAVTTRCAFIASDRSDISMEYRYRRADGTYARVENRIHAVRNDDGIATRLVGSLTDVTERRQLEQQFLQAQKMETVGRLAGGIAHDFSNLMTAIMVNAELDLISPPSDEVLRADLEEIKGTAERAANLSRQLLTFARRQIVEPRVIALNELLDNTERMLQRLIGADIVLRVEPVDAPTTVRIDPGQLEQVLVNMVVNARDAMPAGGQLTIRTRRTALPPSAHGANGAGHRGEAVMLEVADTGTGMTDEVREHAFEPFFTTKGGGGGTGLGLPTSYGIVRQAGGDIAIDSTPGVGTTFRIHLPFVSEHAEPISPPPVESNAPGGHETILLVEDEVSVRRSASRALRQAGYTVLEAADGREGLASGQQYLRSIDLVITDVVMPWIGGKELAETLQQHKPAMRVLFLSGYSDDAGVHAGISDRAIDFIAKPFTPATLARKVRDVLDRETTDAPADETPTPTAR